jgi:hypothetical protein
MRCVVSVVISCVRRGVADTFRPDSRGQDMSAERHSSASGAGNKPWRSYVVWCARILVAVVLRS